MVDLLQGRPETVRFVEELIRSRQDLFFTPHVLYELSRGVRQAHDPASQARRIARLGERFRILPFEREAAVLSSRMAETLADRGEEIPLLDVFIAASALVWGDGVVVTRDLEHFRRLGPFGIRVHSPAR